MTGETVKHVFPGGNTPKAFFLIMITSFLSMLPGFSY